MVRSNVTALHKLLHRAMLAEVLLREGRVLSLGWRWSLHVLPQIGPCDCSYGFRLDSYVLPPADNDLIRVLRRAVIDSSYDSRDPAKIPLD